MTCVWRKWQYKKFCRIWYKNWSFSWCLCL